MSHAGSSGFARDAAVGAVAQLLAGLVFTPVDIVKERLQVVQAAGAGARARDCARCATTIGSCRSAAKGCLASSLRSVCLSGRAPHDGRLRVLGAAAGAARAGVGFAS